MKKNPIESEEDDKQMNVMETDDDQRWLDKMVVGETAISVGLR